MTDYVPSTGKGIAIGVGVALLAFVFVATSGWAPLLLAALVAIPVLFVLYIAGYRVMYALKHGSLRKRRGGES